MGALQEAAEHFLVVQFEGKLTSAEANCSASVVVFLTGYSNALVKIVS